MRLEVPISAGELVDKLTILDLKLARIRCPEKQRNLRREAEALRAVAAQGLPHSATLDRLTAQLAQVNATLWQVEEALRAAEQAGDFSQRFVALARSVYVQNDARARIKKEINLTLGSDLIEEKSYASG